MALSNEELLKPRYKVIAHYPNSCFAVGEVYNLKEIDFGIGSLPVNYPAIFKKLEWWEDRKMEEMPDYVKYGSSIFKVSHKFEVSCKASKNHTGMGLDVAWYTCLPSTEEEYNNQNTTK